MTTTETFAVGDVVKILRLKDPQDTQYVDAQVEITGLTPKGWVKVNLPDGSGSVTLKPDWVEKVSSEILEPASADTETVTEPEQTDQMTEAAPADTETASVVEIQSDESQENAPATTNSQKASTGQFKFSCNSAIFSKAVGQVKRVIRSMSITPVLNNLKISIDAKTRQVTLVGFDLTLGVITRFGAEKVERGGEYTIEATILYGLISQLPESTITLERTEDEPQVKLTTSNGVYFIAGMDAYEYPELPIPQPDDAHFKMWRINAKTLRTGINATAYAAATDLTKMVLCGIHFVANAENKLEIAATDGHRLALYRCVMVGSKNVPEKTDEHLTIPSRSIWEVERYLTQEEAIVEISYYGSDGIANANIVQFSCGEVKIISRTIEGQYPSYNNLIPKKFKREVWIERGMLIGSIGRVSVTADAKHNLIKMDIDSDKKLVTLYTENAALGSGKEALNAEISGESIEVAFNIKYLLDALKSLGTQEAAMSLNEQVMPVICTPLNGHDIVTLIMPVQVRKD